MTRHLHSLVTVAALAVASAAATNVQAAETSAARNLVLQASVAPTVQSQRLALVIGNSAYKEAPLLNPANDARAMAKVLREAGFTVMLHTDIDHRGLLGAVREFGSRLRQGGVGLFYFAGHGMQIKGRNYLIPVGADIQREDEIAYAALDAQAVLDKMESAGNGANLMLLDACRNNPFARSFRSSAQGLAQMEAPVGTLVAFSTAPGSVASDGQGQNGLYTQHLLAAMRKPGAKVEDVFKQVRAAVRRESQGKQIPWEATSLEGDLYFFDPPAAPPVAAPAPASVAAATATVDPAMLDDALWQAVQGTRDAGVIRAYLERFPQGRHASLARQRLVEVQVSAAAPAATSLHPGAGQGRPSNGASRPSPEVAPAGTDTDRATALLQTLAAQQPPRESQKEAAPQADDKRPAATLQEAVPPTTAAPPAQSVASNLPSSVASLPPYVQAEAARLQQQVAAELLANEAAAGRAASASRNKPAEPGRVAPRPQPTAGANGALLPGDLWAFKLFNWGSYNGELTTLQVSQVDEAGVPSFVDDEKVSSTIGRFARQLLSPRAHGWEATPQQQVWWGAMKRGDSRSVTLHGQHRRSDGSMVTAVSAIKLHRRGMERVKVQAGEFDAVRLDAEAVEEFVALSGSQVQQLWALSVWYVPELRGFAATEVEIRNRNGKLDVKRRNELLRFEPGADVVAAR